MATGSHRWIWLGAAGLFCLCVLFKLNGSSVGVWNDILYEPGKPSGLLFSSPKHVRADEWHGWTPAVLSQSRQIPPFPTQNLSLGGDRAPLIMSVPIAHYTMLFRPQFWGFFIFDFERGFSFFWCAKIFSLLIASYWFFRQLGIRSAGRALFGTLWVFFSGYVQWWFSSPAMLPEMLGTWMICVGCGLQLFRPSTRWRTAAAFAGFVFCGVNFVLCLYPPYQIPLMWLMIAIWIGFGLEQRHDGTAIRFRSGALWIAGGVAVTLAFLIPFWNDASSTLDLVAHTDYPGARRSAGGDLSIFKLFSGFAGFFQTEKIFPRIYDNVCEASNFYPLWPAALAAAGFAHWKGRQRIPASLVGIAIAIIFLSLYCVIPLPGWLLHISLLDLTTERRTLLAIGIATIVFCTIFLDRYRQPILSRSRAIALGLAFWVGIAVLLWVASRSRPDFSPSAWQLTLAWTANGVILLFFWESQRHWFAIALIGLLVISNGAVNPIMSGLSPLLQSKAFREIDRLRLSDPTAKWLVYHDFVLAQLVIATGAPILNGNKVVPDFAFLRLIDPDGIGTAVYNRYAYAGCELPTESEKPGVRLLQHDLYVLYLPPQAPLLRQIGCRYFLFPEPWSEGNANGFSLADEIPQSKIYIYRASERDH